MVSEFREAPTSGGLGRAAAGLMSTGLPREEEAQELMTASLQLPHSELVSRLLQLLSSAAALHPCATRCNGRSVACFSCRWASP